MRSSYIVSGSKVAEMTRLLERQGLNSSDLDDLVVDEKRDEAREINAECVESQIEYLISRLGADEFETVLRAAVPGATKLGFD